MSIESKHAYRFGYLKSDKWKQVRLDALLREKGKCQICTEESIFNDAHHVWYPESIYETTEEHLVILCRACHNFIHAIIPECKTKDQEEGKNHWKKFYLPIICWRIQKQDLFEIVPSEEQITEGLQKQAPRELRERLAEVLVQLKKASKIPVGSKPQKKEIIDLIRQWADCYYASGVNSPVADSDFSI
jgi:hypothetical protein